jgi:hypothetical protein
MDDSQRPNDDMPDTVVLVGNKLCQPLVPLYRSFCWGTIHLITTGYKTLKAGQIVSFEIVQGPKGLHAVKITNVPVENDKTAPANQQEKVSS